MTASNAPLHIAVDAMNLLHDRRGIGRYARALLQRWMSKPQEQVRITLLVPRPRWFGVRRGLAEVLGRSDLNVASRDDVGRLNPHVVWYPWNGMTWISPCVNIATVHDVWPFESPAEDPRKRHNEQMPFLATATHARAIVTDSHFSKNEILKHLAVPAQRVRVVHLGVDAPVPAPEPALLLDGAQRYVLFVGESEPRKDPATLHCAMAKLADALRMTTGLVIAGKSGQGQTKRGRVDSVRRHGAQTHVLRFEPQDSVLTLCTGEVSSALLRQLYAGASAFVFPSRYEGFGLPVLEAMAAGIPVIASNAASVPEAAGDAALYFPAGNAGALGVELTRVLGDRVLSAQLSAAGLARAAAMTWERCAEETLRVFKEAARLAASPPPF